MFTARFLPFLLLSGCAWYIGDDDARQWSCEHWFAEGDWYLDADRDGHGVRPATLADCPERDQFVAAGDDCDDEDASRFPGNPELCQDGIDQDCDGEDPQRQTWYPDDDGDGFGDEAGALNSCTQPEGSVSIAGDCDDDDASSFPGGQDPVCGDGIDQDCDGRVDCSLSGDVDLADGWSAWGVTRTLNTGSPTGLAAGVDVDGDGIADVVASALDQSWLVTVGADRDDASDRLDPPISTEASVGLSVAMVEVGESGLIALGSRDLESTGGTGDGAVAVLWNGDADRIGWIRSAIGQSFGGAAVAGRDGTLVVSARTDGETTLDLDVWGLTVLSGVAIPDPDEQLRLDQAISDAVIETDPSYFSTIPVLALGSDDEGLELAVSFVPQLGIETGTRIYWYDAPLSGDLTSDDAGFSFVDGDLNQASSLALIDMDGDGVLDLAFGSPDDDEVWILPGPPGEAEYARDHYFSATGAGGALANVGDVNGDGLDDLAIGAPIQSCVWLFPGGAAAERGEMSYVARITGPEDSELGASLAGADVDGDGWSDVIIGAPGSASMYILWGGP